MKIKKFRLISERPEENEFLVKKIKKTVHFLEHQMITDDHGNIISQRDPNSQKFVPSSKVTEGIVAYSLPSMTPAHVEILETDDGLSGEFDKSNSEMEKVEPTDASAHSRPKAMNLTKILDPDIDRRAVILPKSQGIQWAD